MKLFRRPYSAIAHALQKLVQQLLGEPDEQLQQWRLHLLNTLGSNGQLIIDVIPEQDLRNWHNWYQCIR